MLSSGFQDWSVHFASHCAAGWLFCFPIRRTVIQTNSYVKCCPLGLQILPCNFQSLQHTSTALSAVLAHHTFLWRLEPGIHALLGDRQGVGGKLGEIAFLQVMLFRA